MARVRQINAAEFAPFLDRLAGPKFDTTAGAISPGAMCQDAALFGIEGEGGGLVGAYALRVAGQTVWLLAAVSDPGVDFEREILPLIEHQAGKVGQVAVTTRRRGGVKKLLRQGYEITGYTLRKNLKR